MSQMHLQMKRMHHLSMNRCGKGRKRLRLRTKLSMYRQRKRPRNAICVRYSLGISLLPLRRRRYCIFGIDFIYLLSATHMMISYTEKSFNGISYQSFLLPTSSPFVSAPYLSKLPPQNYPTTTQSPRVQLQKKPHPTQSNLETIPKIGQLLGEIDKMTKNCKKTKRNSLPRNRRRKSPSSTMISTRPLIP